jgi:hypothetical protein
MKFKYLKSPHPKTQAHPDLKWFRRPIISLDIINGSTSAKIYALMDSGSDFCLFQGSLGTQIGLDVPKGKLEEIKGSIIHHASSIFAILVKTRSRNMYRMQMYFAWLGSEIASASFAWLMYGDNRLISSRTSS